VSSHLVSQLFHRGLKPKRDIRPLKKLEKVEIEELTRRGDFDQENRFEVDRPQGLGFGPYEFDYYQLHLRPLFLVFLVSCFVYLLCKRGTTVAAPTAPTSLPGVQPESTTTDTKRREDRNEKRKKKDKKEKKDKKHHKKDRRKKDADDVDSKKYKKRRRHDSP